jgi:hypothetical protein
MIHEYDNCGHWANAKSTMKAFYSILNIIINNECFERHRRDNDDNMASL